MPDKLKNILNALCLYHGRCILCYRDRKNNECVNCGKHYFECDCLPLTSQEILKSQEWE